MHVLVVDDDPAARFVAKRWLTATLGCRVVDCQDGVRALELLTSKRFDLALIDLELPGLTGLEIVEAIRSSETTATLPIIVLSGERREDVVKELAILGISAYLLKPLRERAVVERIGPILASLPRRTHSLSEGECLLSPDEPAMLVDGDQNFRHLFGQLAEAYGPVMVAESGAEALSKFRRSPVGLVFIGQSLGILGTATLVKKIRDVATDGVRIVGLGPPPPEGESLFDATMPRSFVTDDLERQLRRFVRIVGPLSRLQEVAPQFDTCLTSAVVQVFGMMGGLTAEPASPGGPDDGPGIVVAMTVDVDGRFLLDLELGLPVAIAQETSVRLLCCEPGDVDDEARTSTAGELGNMVSGRLDAWFKARGLTCKFSLPAMRPAVAAELAEPIAPSDGYVHRFRVSDVSAHLLLRVRARQAESLAA